LQNEPETEHTHELEVDIAKPIREKLRADLHALSSAVAGCSSCPGGGKGIPGCGEAGADLFLLAGMPGPGADARNPWGRWREQLLTKVCGEWGWEMERAYLSTALRCRLPKVTRREVRRCAAFLADELFIVGPRLAVISGKVAAVALREALGNVVPENPRAGDTCSLYSTTFLFELDIARIGEDKGAAAIFWNILRQVEDLGAGHQD
jgi:uracil-DNA glycosylase